MELTEIKAKADEEAGIPLHPYINKILEQIELYPSGTDMSFPGYIILGLEKYCDDKGIPFYWVAEETISVAKTYTQLYYYEKER